MPKDKVKFDTFLLAQRDIENLNKKAESQKK
jgi:hypothetical protein